MELIGSFLDAFAICWVDYEDDGLCVGKIVSPKRPDFVLASDIPHRKCDVLIFDSLNVKSWILYLW